MRSLALFAAPVALATSPSAAQVTADDGRLLGHLPYTEAAPADLAAAPPGFAVGQPCRLRPAVLPDLSRLLDAAAAAGLGETLHGLSCFRSVARQQAVFCRTAAACADAARRAESVGPPGHSEHATGYAIDFAVRPSRGCADVADCIADTAAGRWLLANAPAYGFELSFPDGNAQGVTYEPWHWRWAGTSQDEPGAAEARATFSGARTRFPASPEEAGFALHVAGPPEARR
ncbi:MAG: M15 family metallopeptidase [Janthinobacterium lividum]